MTLFKTATALVLLGTASVAQDQDQDNAQEISNLSNFHLVDFIGWNNANMDLMRKYHSPDVAVDIAGTHTDGINPHVEALMGFLSQGAAKITQHSPSLAQGEWTAVVGVTATGNMATIASWKDGAMTAEYLFIRPMTAEETAAIDVSAPIVTITTPDDAALRAATGAEPGWSAVMVDGFAVFTQTIAGQVSQTLGFASK